MDGGEKSEKIFSPRLFLFPDNVESRDDKYLPLIKKEEVEEGKGREQHKRKNSFLMDKMY